MRRAAIPPYREDMASDRDSIEALKKRAVDLKLDTAAFNTCLDSGAQAAAVAQAARIGPKASAAAVTTDSRSH